MLLLQKHQRMRQIQRLGSSGVWKTCDHANCGANQYRTGLCGTTDTKYHYRNNNGYRCNSCPAHTHSPGSSSAGISRCQADANYILVSPATSPRSCRTPPAAPAAPPSRTARPTPTTGTTAPTCSPVRPAAPVPPAAPVASASAILATSTRAWTPPASLVNTARAPCTPRTNGARHPGTRGRMEGIVALPRP